MEIPAEDAMRVLLCPGRTYLFKAEEHFGDKKHFHVVLNLNPHHDELVIMIPATTVTLKHSSGYWTALSTQGVIVRAGVGEAEFIEHPTLFRCDQPILRSKDDIVGRIDGGTLIQKGVVPEALLARLRAGVLASKTVTENVKALVRETAE